MRPCQHGAMAGSAAQRHSHRTVVVIGGSGFLGRHVTAELARRGIRAVTVSRREAPDPSSSVEHRRCDITTDPASVRRTLDGCAAVINASSYVGNDTELQERVNVDGVRHVAAAAEAMNIPLVHLSTAGVYGDLPFAGGEEGDYAPNPESSLSLARARGDELALRGRATLIRPLFVSGVGDTHFLRPLLHLHVRLGAWIAGGAARLSVAPAELVAAAAVGAVEGRLQGFAPELVHAVPDRPVTVRELLTPTLTEWGALPHRSLTADDAIERLAAAGVPARKVRQFARDYFISSRLLRRLISDGPGVPAVSLAARAWYTAQRPTAPVPPKPPTMSS